MIEIVTFFVGVFLALLLIAVFILAAHLFWHQFFSGWPTEAEKDLGTYANHFVYVNEDGSARELTPDEREYLNTKFLPGDSGRPYIKSRYQQLTPDGKIWGFLLRQKLPHSYIYAADEKSAIEQAAKNTARYLSAGDSR